MIKAYFFDWMCTLANASERKNVREFVKDDGHVSMLMNRFNDANIPEEHRALVFSLLNNAEHKLYPESRFVIDRLRPNYKLAVISNIYDISLQKIKEYFPDFLEKFDVLTWSCEVKMKKPNPQIFLYTCEKVGVKPEEVIMIGDKSDKDVEPANKIGIQGRLVNRLCQTLEDVI